jgi:hypothetical protein
MRVVILQPSYLPWLGYFDQISKADVFVYYDDVPYDKHGWRNRNKIKTAQGEAWLTVPVKTSYLKKTALNKVPIVNERNWRGKHLKSLEINYAKAPYFDEYIGILRDAYTREWLSLVELNVFLIREICKVLNIMTRFMFASELNVAGDKTQRLINICKYLGAGYYLTGDSARDYLQEELFAMNSVVLEYQNYSHPTYPQLYAGFIPYLSVVDLLFNCGPQSLDVLSNKKTINKEIPL